MSQGPDPSIVTAYYRNAKTGRVDVYQLPSIVFQEASQGRYVENRWVVPEDADAWSDKPPEVGEHEFDDHRPVPAESLIPQPQPPPAFAPHSPVILKGRGASPAPPFPHEPKPVGPGSSRRKV